MRYVPASPDREAYSVRHLLFGKNPLDLLLQNLQDGADLVDVNTIGVHLSDNLCTAFFTADSSVSVFNSFHNAYLSPIECRKIHGHAFSFFLFILALIESISLILSHISHL